METESKTELTLDERQEPLIEVLENLEAQIEKQNSLKSTFIKGAIYGLGTVVGATVLVALFGGVIASTLRIFTDHSVF
jgi:hypothetical protein